jgi:hypothetical protein
MGGKVMFKKATKEKSKLRLALMGVSGSGKTMSALSIASNLGSKIAVIDTESGSASKYSDLFEFDVCELEPPYTVKKYLEIMEYAEDAGYDVLIIDSLSHAWIGEGGALEQVDAVAKRMKGNSYMAWGEVTPMYRKLFDAIIRSKLHVIATMRSKTEYVVEQVNGRNVPRKVGLAPQLREGSEYEFDVVAEMDSENNMVVTKSRIPALSERVFKKPGKEVSKLLNDWLNSGESPRTVTKEPYTFWKSPDDATNWAAIELDISPEEAQLILDRTEPENGKKMIPFYRTILEMRELA